MFSTIDNENIKSSVFSFDYQIDSLNEYYHEDSGLTPENYLKIKKFEEENELPYLIRYKIGINEKLPMGNREKKNQNQFDKKENFQLFDIPKKDYASIYNKNPLFKKVGKSIVKRRKYMKDLIRKRIKSNLFKEIKNKLNYQLKRYKIQEILVLEKLFEFPQNMITNVAKKENHIYIEKTLKEILFDGGLEYNIQMKNKSILENNKKIINILSMNGIRIFDDIWNAKLEDIYDEYLKSEPFQKSIKRLINEGNNFEYIHNYIEVANNLVNYYKNYNETITNKRKSKEN